MKNIPVWAAALALSSPVMAQEGGAVSVDTAPAVRSVTVPSNTEVVLRMNDDLTTKGGQVQVGHTFNLTVAYDVKINGVTAIPAGTRAKGEVTMRTGRAVFGKSGKMEIDLRSIEMDGQRIPISGKYKQEGEGNTLAAVGAVVLAGGLLFVTGKSALIPRGRELTAYTSAPATIILR